MQSHKNITIKSTSSGWPVTALVGNKAVQEMGSRIRNKKFITIDCGKNAMTYYDGQGDKGKEIAKEELRNLPSKYPGFVIIGEDAHFGVPRTIKSKAQPFTKEELLEFYNDCANNDVLLRLYPQGSTPKALKFSGFKLGGKVYEDGDKSDENDPVAIHKFVSAKFPEGSISLKCPATDFEIDPLRQWGFLERKKLSNQLCDARGNEHGSQKGYARNGLLRDDVAGFMYDNLVEVYKLISPECREAFGMKASRPNKETGEFKVPLSSVKTAQVYTILSFLMGEVLPVAEDSETYYISTKLRKRPLDNFGNEELVSWTCTKKFLLLSSPWHRKGGVARSNIYYHGARNFIKMKMFNLFNPDAVAEASSIPKSKDARTEEQQERYEVLSEIKKAFNKSLGEQGPGGFDAEKYEAFRKFRAEYLGYVRELFNAFRAIITR